MLGISSEQKALLTWNKELFIIIKGLSVVRSCLRPESGWLSKVVVATRPLPLPFLRGCFGSFECDLSVKT